MNYYNPYFTSYPSQVLGAGKTGLFGKLFSGINFSSILSGTQKTLNIVNQTLPLIKQAQPIFRNAKTMFNVMNEFKKLDTPTTTESVTNNNVDEIKRSVETNYTTSNNGPTFFI